MDDFKFEYELKEPGPNRILYVAEAFRRNYSIQDVYNISKIDFWFLENIYELIKIELKISKRSLVAYLKRICFS